jgi:autotransporter-associated beta strand protein
MEPLFFALRDLVNPIMQDSISQTLNQSFYNAWIVADTRRLEFFSQLAQYGLWPATLAPEFSQHGGTIAPNTQLSFSNPNGSGNVYYTTNGVDPRVLGGSVSGTQYTGPIILASTCTLKARTLSAGGEWSPLQEAFFLVPVSVPAFQPTGNAYWTADANWSSAPLRYPSGTNVAVFVNAPVTADREINLQAPVAVGSVTVQQNDSAFVNRVSDKGVGNTLTFAATNGAASVVVNGTGSGYAEFKVGAGAVLASDLRLVVNNTVGSTAYGALRLREVWRGSGGLTKEGDGIATFTGDGKSYAGATVINRGVLALTQPAVPLQSASLSVTSGGQLRLTSASTDGAPRIYTFNGNVSLDSLGRGGELPPSGQGVSGGLRYQPETDDSIAIITNSIQFNGLSGVHVEGSRNTLELAGPLAGTAGFVKTGSGNLILSAQSKRYLAPVIVSNGTLTVSGRVLSAVEVAASGSLSGTGRVGPLFGAGTVSLDKTVFASPFVVGLNYAFSFSTVSPAYASVSASGNGVLRVLTLYPAETPSVIDIYLDGSALTEGNCLRGGFFVEGELGMDEFLNNATVRFFEPDVNGTQKFAGRTYSPYSGTLSLAVTAMPEAADFGDGPRNGQVMEIRAGGAPVSYGQWLAGFTAVSVNPGMNVSSSPTVDPFGMGVPNLLRYAFGIGPGSAIAERMPRFALESGRPVYRFRFDPGKRDLVYRVEASRDLREWSRVLFDSSTDRPAAWDGETLMLIDKEAGPDTSGTQFYRLRVLLGEP